MEEIIRAPAQSLDFSRRISTSSVSVEKARSKGHIHLDEVIARAELFENEAILFTHFSARYSADDIRRILETRLPASLRDRVTPLLPPAVREAG